MTTIAYRDGIMASDSRCTRGDQIVPGTYQKIYRLPDGALFAFCGSTSLEMRILEALMDDEDVPPFKVKDGRAFLVRPNGTKWTYEGDGAWLPFTGPYFAMGSGEDYAYGALWSGKDAAEAVRCAKDFDSASGGKVQTMKLKESK